MLLFLLPYSKKQHPITFKNCAENRFNLEEFEPLSRLFEKGLSLNSTLAPLYRRFGNSFWESLELWVMPPDVVKYIVDNSWVLSPIYGLIKANACIPYGPIDWRELYQDKSLFDFWKNHIRNLSEKLLKGKWLVPFVSKRYLSLFDISSTEGIVKFEYYRKEAKVKNPQKHYAYTLRYIAEKNIDLFQIHRINFYDYKVHEVVHKEKEKLVILKSEGKYEL
ncbi:MAG: peroxide stress protein YaaA [Aquificaceae bacterium]